MSKVVVTGGAGFIGSHIVDKLGQEGHDVTIIDNLDPYYSPDLKKKNLDIVLKHRNVKFVQGDICDLKFLKGVVGTDTNYIYHEAAQPGVRISVEDPFKPNNVNVLGTLNVLKAGIDADVERIINASSSSVYGKSEYLPFDEKHPTQPVSPYGVSKLAAEHYCRVFNEIYGIPTVSLRYFTVYGPRMRPDLAINIFTKAILTGKPITIFGDGTFTRDFTYIDDVVSVNLKLMETNKADGKTLNIGCGNRISVNDLVENLFKIIGKETEIIYTDVRRGDAKDTMADVSLLWNTVGYKPKIDIKQGLKKYVEWYRGEL